MVYAYSVGISYTQGASYVSTGYDGLLHALRESIAASGCSDVSAVLLASFDALLLSLYYGRLLASNYLWSYAAT